MLRVSLAEKLLKGNRPGGARPPMQLISDRTAFHIIIGLCCLAACVADIRSQELRITDANLPIEASLTNPSTPSRVSVSQVAPAGPVVIRNPSLNEVVLRETAKYNIDPL